MTDPAIEDPAFDEMLARLRDDDREVREAAANILYELGDRRTFPALLELAMGDDDTEVTATALRALGQFAHTDDVIHLTETLELDGDVSGARGRYQLAHELVRDGPTESARQLADRAERLLDGLADPAEGGDA